MPRIYSEIRISHKTEEEKADFKLKANQQASKLGLNLSEYIRLIIELDAATNLIEKLKCNQTSCDICDYKTLYKLKDGQ